MILAVTNEAIPDEQYIVVGYTDDQEDNYILERDVVRPLNHKWSLVGDPEITSWKLKSTGHCPTYGSCTHCYRSRPVRKSCVQHQDYMYKVMLMREYDRKYIIDSKTLADLIGTGHEMALASRTQAWVVTPTHETDLDILADAIEREYKDMDCGKE